MNVREVRSFYLEQLQSRLGSIVAEMTRWSSSSLAVSAWHPAINAFRCQGSIVICAELAGVDRSDINLAVDPQRVWLRGRRLSPEPCGAEGPALQVVAMEIDNGMFEREIVLPAEVEPERVQAEQRDGLLWIVLPLRCSN